MSRRKEKNNAFTKGLFAQYFKPEEIKALKKMDWSDLTYEEFAHRSIAGRLLKFFDALTQMDQPDFKQLSSLLYALHLNTISTTTSARAHAFINGKDKEMDEALLDALDDVPFDTPGELTDEL